MESVLVYRLPLLKSTSRNITDSKYFLKKNSFRIWRWSSFLIIFTKIFLLAWSKEGCETFPGTFQGTIKCKCTHLTNFALLLDINQSGSNPLSLKIVTWIGCAISTFGLLITVISFTIFRYVCGRVENHLWREQKYVWKEIS